jgi:two-component system, response regulator
MNTIEEYKTIMIIEDSLDDVEAIKRAFTLNEIKNPIKHCENGEDAMDFLFNKSAELNEIPGLILLDLNMPKTDGRVTLQIIKKDPRFAKIPVIILTTSLDERDVEKCYEYGANSYLQKPVKFEDLVSSIGKLKDFWFDVGRMPRIL